jgi:hypothetical protein
MNHEREKKNTMSLKRKMIHAASVMLLTSGLICNVDTLAQSQVMFVAGSNEP